MGTLKRADATRTPIAEGRTRYLSHTDNLMIVVIDLDDGPAAEPDPPHSHPHEQVAYVAEGEIIFFLDGIPTKLGPGDVYTVPPNVPHSIQLLTEHARLVDVFTPLREDFLE